MPLSTIQFAMLIIAIIDLIDWWIFSKTQDETAFYTGIILTIAIIAFILFFY